MSCYTVEAHVCSLQIVDLESRLSQALQENANMVLSPVNLNQRSNPDWLPTATPPKLVLTGHRANVNAVTFHPRYSMLVAASDDNTMTVWDWETGELERTLQGHTRRVSDCDYDSKGKYLGEHGFLCVYASPCPCILVAFSVPITSVILCPGAPLMLPLCSTS